jgi:hypothetical protein
MQRKIDSLLTFVHDPQEAGRAIRELCSQEYASASPSEKELLKLYDDAFLCDWIYPNQPRKEPAFQFLGPSSFASLPSSFIEGLIKEAERSPSLVVQAFFIDIAWEHARTTKSKSSGAATVKAVKTYLELSEKAQSNFSAIELASRSFSLSVALNLSNDKELAQTQLASLVRSELTQENPDPHAIFHALHSLQNTAQRDKATEGILLNEAFAVLTEDPYSAETTAELASGVDAKLEQSAQNIVLEHFFKEGETDSMFSQICLEKAEKFKRNDYVQKAIVQLQNHNPEEMGFEISQTIIIQSPTEKFIKALTEEAFSWRDVLLEIGARTAEGFRTEEERKKLAEESLSASAVMSLVPINIIGPMNSTLSKPQTREEKIKFIESRDANLFLQIQAQLCIEPALDWLHENNMPGSPKTLDLQDFFTGHFLTGEKADNPNPVPLKVIRQRLLSERGHLKSDLRGLQSCTDVTCRANHLYEVAVLVKAVDMNELLLLSYLPPKCQNKLLDLISAQALFGHLSRETADATKAGNAPALAALIQPLKNIDRTIFHDVAALKGCHVHSAIS